MFTHKLSLLNSLMSVYATIYSANKSIQTSPVIETEAGRRNMVLIIIRRETFEPRLHRIFEE